MLQLKQLAVELEKRHDLLQAVSERESLVRENQTLLHQLDSQKENAQESPTATNQLHGEDNKMMMKQECPEDPETQERDKCRPEIKWETRTFEW
ncbi:hypothetical protein BBO99_00004421 [Phytophthora kernoviae]|uniref:Uncharacterized protein n=2 Tax=Phytophthora kernoviae TaxID=325452 RepID=A0A3R7GHF6_9STRA|nr:hypothetical protein G195_008111 [Phytophthora kernoviae 00238/432]KAG2521137.1 hypothetical protein JM16_006389 [Phytophthora kernoviae]KAG2522247.1 hypothetical protein JM18_006243 [Phytophthora kernoviae]RLM97641.1 hypothetical protein BBI17_008907 [Phytophthora kernoviae]RLN80534.1 hypothetical protein BBO99_00004421 [Phytophthora kernoviae]